MDLENGPVENGTEASESSKDEAAQPDVSVVCETSVCIHWTERGWKMITQL